ncbi:MAG: hypothetical protein A2W93_14470 [Bacteroidetes bacterium GWF2_43_63]|nr:MAG: hypothetical protein A2W94_01040 [Bacteroidetes bacterium GWE2_42_42]OFY52545.1 MAG: hypothetical protein A2W93_14470 [Bacteroidetes bacterium GWF2_43_63]HBG71453.1 hypothetical protein [Bacteroidales bacterium]HCB60795.1 hypothetical protein [Bacteroidales bacterium]HCY23480.1 hypothetical protein [Bacteroidales bacterium]
MEANENLPATQEDFSVDKFTELSKAAPDILNQNKSLRLKAETSLKAINGLPIDEKSDTLRKEFIDNCKKAKTRMKDRRTPFTQMVDAVKKLFTTEEAWFDETIKTVQEDRNKYAAEVLKKQQEAEAAAKKELDRKNTLAFIRQILNTKLAEIESTVITNHQQTVNEYLQMLTIANINSAIPSRDNPVTIPVTVEGSLKEHVGKNLSAYQKSLVPVEEIDKMALEVSETFNQARVIAECDKINERAKSDLPALKKKLQEIETAKTDVEKEALKQQISDKIQDDTKQVIDEAKKVETDASQTAATHAGVEQIQNQLELHIAYTTLDVKKSKKIVILNKEGYMNIFAMWFEREGKDLPDAKLQNMTVARMVTFCEKMADAGVVIASPHVSYQDKVVAK